MLVTVHLREPGGWGFVAVGREQSLVVGLGARALVLASALVLVVRIRVLRVIPALVLVRMLAPGSSDFVAVGG